MPATEVELDDGDEALGRVVYRGDVKEHFWVAHEAARGGVSVEMTARRGVFATHFVILSSMLRGSRMKVGRTTRLRSAPGRSWEMMCERTGRRADCQYTGALQAAAPRGSAGGSRARRGSCAGRARRRTGSPLPWSGSTTCVSSSLSPTLASSVEERALPAGCENQLVNILLPFFLEY